jgi:AcrR family transcriptional regulator
MEILRAAAKVFRASGFAGAGMREIAAAADLSPGILYHYFAGKHEILAFCQERALEKMLASVGAARASRPPLAEQLRAIVRSHILCLLDDVDGSAAHLEIDSLPPKLRSRIIAKRDEYERAIRKLISDGVAKKQFSPCDPNLVTRAILGAANWTAQWYRPGGDQSPAEVADALAAYLVNGLSR